MKPKIETATKVATKIARSYAEAEGLPAPTAEAVAEAVADVDTSSSLPGLWAVAEELTALAEAAVSVVREQ